MEERRPELEPGDEADSELEELKAEAGSDWEQETGQPLEQEEQESTDLGVKAEPAEAAEEDPQRPWRRRRKSRQALEEAKPEFDAEKQQFDDLCGWAGQPRGRPVRTTWAVPNR